MRRIFGYALATALLTLRCASTTPAGEKVRIAKNDDDVFGCEQKGTVAAKGMGSIADAMNSVRNKTADLGGNTLRVTRTDAFWGIVEGVAYDCDPEAMRKRNETLPALANRTITCNAGADCEYKWSRSMEWVQDNSTWKFRTVTDTLLTTEGPLDTARPAFEVAKLSQGDGKTYRITFRAWCGVGNCENLILHQHIEFNDFVLAPPKTQ